MKLYRVILLVFVFMCFLSFSSGIAVAGEYVAKQGDTWAKVAKATGNKVDELAKMNKVKDIKDSDPVSTGQKVIFLGKDDIDDAKQWCEKRHKELDYGTGEYSKNFAALNNLKAKRFEYSPDDPYPYGIRFTEVFEYAEKWRKK